MLDDGVVEQGFEQRGAFNVGNAPGDDPAAKNIDDDIPWSSSYCRACGGADGPSLIEPTEDEATSDEVYAARQKTLDAAFQSNPERFVRCRRLLAAGQPLTGAMLTVGMKVSFGAGKAGCGLVAALSGRDAVSPQAARKSIIEVAVRPLVSAFICTTLREAFDRLLR